MNTVSVTLVALAFLLTLAATFGVVRAPQLFARLHYVSLATLLPPLLVLLARPSLKAAIVIALVVAPSPLITHLVARATCLRRNERPPT